MANQKIALISFKQYTIIKYRINQFQMPNLPTAEFTKCQVHQVPNWFLPSST